MTTELRKLIKDATKGPWTTHKRNCCRSIDYENGVICQMMNNKVDMGDATGLAPSRKQSDINKELIVYLANRAEAIAGLVEAAERTCVKRGFDDEHYLRQALAAWKEIK